MSPKVFLINNNTDVTYRNQTKIKLNQYNYQNVYFLGHITLPNVYIQNAEKVLIT